MAKKSTQRKSKAVDVKVDEGKADDKKIENWANKPDSDLYAKCLGYYRTIGEAFKNRDEANDAIVEYWNIYNAQPDSNQTYTGNSRCYIPAVRDAINARSKRTLRQLFPNKYRHVEAVGSDKQDPQPQLALLEHYIRKTKLRALVRSLLISGDVTGQWSLYIDWKQNYRTLTDVIQRNPILETVDGQPLEIEAPDEVEDKVEVEETITISDAGPEVVDIATEDLVVIPPTCNEIEKADITAVKLRMSKEQIKKMVDEGIFVLPPKSEISDWMEDRKGEEKYNPEKSRVGDAGIKTKGTFKYALIYEAHVRMKFTEDGEKELAYVYYAGENDCIGIIKAPQWGQKRPIISAPVDRIAGSFNGISKVEAVKFLQWNLNDFWNMGQDSAMYSLLPVVMTDPEKNPNYAMMVFGLAAVWPVDPNSTKFQSFPQLWKDSVQMCGSIEARINQALDVNDMMMGRAGGGKKNAQVAGAQMQEGSVAVVDHAERFEEEILNPLMERFFEYDAQFRDEEMSVMALGNVGVNAAIMSIPPNQWGDRYFFQWTGTGFVMNMQRMQQQIATMNVLRGIPPQQLNGRRLDITPILENMVENVFGPELGGQILIDERNKFTVDAEIENEMMVNHIMVDVHEADDDVAHIQSHSQAGKVSQDPTGQIRAHINAHMQALQKKRQMAQPAPQGGEPGIPGGAGPGVAGTPRMGAQPQMPRPGQNPAGSIHPDQMPGGVPRG